MNAVILAFAVLGFLGALSTDVRYLQLVSTCRRDTTATYPCHYHYHSPLHSPTGLFLCYVVQYLLMLVLLFAWELIWILVEAIGYKVSLSALTWDIALCCVLAVVSDASQHSTTYQQRSTHTSRMQGRPRKELTIALLRM